MRRALALAAYALAALTAASCQRRPQFAPAAADSTAGTPRDSFAVLARQAADQWDAGQDEPAASLSAQVVMQALRLRPTAPWPERSRGVLDSLGIAGEVEGDERFVVLNLFSRARGGDASYPFLVWREKGPKLQPLESPDLHLTAVAGRGFTFDSEATDSARAAVLWGRRVGAGQQPVLMVWRHAQGGRWDLEQTLGPDSLGGTGTGEFAGADTGLVLTTRTYRATPYFDECATCPHVFHERRFAWHAAGFQRVGDDQVPSTYSSFTAFVAALVAGDRAGASRWVVDPALIDFARRYDWHVPARGRWRLAPASDEGSTSLVFLRGATDAFRVTFEARDGDFVIAGFEATARPMD